MEITLIRNTARKGDLLVYSIDGRPGSVQFTSKALFNQDAVPATLRLVGEFAPPKPKETPEERKARVKAITPAERLAKMEARIAKMKAKLAKGNAASANAKGTPPAASKGKK